MDWHQAKIIIIHAFVITVPTDALAPKVQAIGSFSAEGRVTKAFVKYSLVINDYAVIISITLMHWTWFKMAGEVSRNKWHTTTLILQIPVTYVIWDPRVVIIMSADSLAANNGDSSAGTLMTIMLHLFVTKFLWLWFKIILWIRGASQYEEVVLPV